MRHRKIQKNNRRKKLKPVFPFNKNSPKNDSAKSSINNPPENGDQAAPKSFVEFQRNLIQFSEKSKNKGQKCEEKETGTKAKRRKKSGNEGFLRNPWETDSQFYARVCRETDEYVQEEYMKIKYGIQESSKIHEKSSEKSWVQAKKKQPDPSLSISEKNLLETGNTRQSSSHDSVKRNNTHLPETSGRKNRRKRKNRPEKVDLLNRKDFVAFGERVDRPPEFLGPSKKSLKAVSAQAGKKELLLKSVLAKSSDSSRPAFQNASRGGDSTLKIPEDPEKERILRQERQRVIDLYRASKRT